MRLAPLAAFGAMAFTVGAYGFGSLLALGKLVAGMYAAIFVAQATNTPLTLADQLLVLGVLMVTSKGSAGVTGSGFITLAATLASLGKIPVSGMVLLLGVDRFMSEARVITNTIGNAVGTMAIARWVGALDEARVRQVLDGVADPEDPPTR